MQRSGHPLEVLDEGSATVEAISQVLAKSLEEVSPLSEGFASPSSANHRRLDAAQPIA
ncbi:MAG: hypothetical protein JF621_01850 [Streptomyces turgidiscabies]|nr:hypothetical protein [Streptomyces turgidiscabies]